MGGEKYAGKGNNFWRYIFFGGEREFPRHDVRLLFIGCQCCVHLSLKGTSFNILKLASKVEV